MNSVECRSGFGKLPPPAWLLIFRFFSITFHIAVVIGSDRIAPSAFMLFKSRTCYAVRTVPPPPLKTSVTLPLIEKVGFLTVG